MPNKKDNRKVVIRIVQDEKGYSAISEMNSEETERILLNMALLQVKINQRDFTLKEIKKRETKIVSPYTGQPTIGHA